VFVPNKIFQADLMNEELFQSFFYKALYKYTTRNLY